MVVSYLSLDKYDRASRNRREHEMKTTRIQLFAAVTAVAVIFLLSMSAQAQSASETLYKGKCAACHGADGTGSAMGTKMGAHDFTTAAVQGMSDAALTETITNGKNKMPKYGTSLKPEDIKGLVAYIRTLKK
jgi:cytochrome c6